MENDETNYRGMGISRNQYIGLLSTLCNQGDAEGRYLMGELFEEGEAVERNIEEAMALYRLSAEQGFVKAQYRLGFKLFMGHDCEAAPGEGVRLVRLAAEQGDAMAHFLLGLAYMAGRGVARDVESGLAHFRKSAEGGYSPAAAMLKGIEEDGVGSQEFYADMCKVKKITPDERLAQAYRRAASDDVAEQRAAFEQVRELAAQGHAKSCFLLACMYRDGRGTAVNQAEHVAWLYRAAEGGMAEAQHYMGYLYANGEGVAQDYAAAAYWRTLAAEQGVIESLRSLAAQYLEGAGVPKDESAAVYWYTRAAAQGDAKAQYLLAEAYREGKGVQKDIEKMKYWLKQSVDQSYAPAQLLLGVFLAGAGDWKSAFGLLTAAAEQNDWQSMVCLTVLYAKGKGTKRSLDRAEDYARMAAAYASQKERQDWYESFVRTIKL